MPQARSSTGPPAPRTKGTSLRVDTKRMRNDRLGTLVSELASLLHTADSWEEFARDFQGRSYLAEGLDSVDHPAAPLLRRWRDEGVPVLSSAEPWTAEQKDAAVARGCHPSASEHSEFLRNEMAEFIDNKFWAVLPYSMVKHLDLRFSPAAVKDERNRKPRLLCDHSWPWPWSPSVNDTTLPVAPPEAMQFGQALKRVLFYARHADPKFGVIKGSKHDMKDGYYKLHLRPADCLKLALLLPQYEGEEQLVAIPMSLTMGWCQSPPSYCVMSETICDQVNAKIAKAPLAGRPHRLSARAEAHDDNDRSLEPRDREKEDADANEALTAIPGALPVERHDVGPPPPSNRPFKRPVAHTDVFVDDFIQIAQGSKNKLRSVRNHLLHTVDEVMDAPGAQDGRQEPISTKKLDRGDGSWMTRKEILGWLADFARQTLELPPHRKQEMARLFIDMAGKKRVSEKKWRKFLGKLRFITQGVQGSVGLFSVLQLALQRTSDGRIRINRNLRHHIDSFASLVASVCDRPTYFAELVEQDPSLAGTTDAAKMGMGGVYFDHTEQGWVWRLPFPLDLQARLASAENPKGDVTNSDFEQAGTQGQVRAMATTHDLHYATISTGMDNTPALGRLNKGAVSSDGAASFLCNLACAHQRKFRYCHVGHFLPGPLNVMADDASRLQHLTDSAFLSHFNQQYPQPRPWRLAVLPTEEASALISALRSKRPLPPPQSRPASPRTPTSPSGCSSATTTATTLPSLLSTATRPSSPTSSSLASVTDAGPAAPVSLSGLIPWVKRSRQSGRGWPTWVSAIPAKHGTAVESSIPYSLLSSTASSATTTHPRVHTPPTSPSSKPSTEPSTSQTPSGVGSTPTSATSPSWGSSGCSALPSTPTGTPLTRAPRRSACATLNSPSLADTTTARRRL